MYLRDPESGLWPPTPHVKDIPGGHPHLPQINNDNNDNDKNTDKNDNNTNKNNDFDNDNDISNSNNNNNTNNNNNLREVGVPSRNILHVRGRGSKSRTRVAGRVRVADAQEVS